MIYGYLRSNSINSAFKAQKRKLQQHSHVVVTDICSDVFSEQANFFNLKQKLVSGDQVCVLFLNQLSGNFSDLINVISHFIYNDISFFCVEQPLFNTIDNAPIFLSYLREFKRFDDLRKFISEDVIKDVSKLQSNNLARLNSNNVAEMCQFLYPFYQCAYNNIDAIFSHFKFNKSVFYNYCKQNNIPLRKNDHFIYLYDEKLKLINFKPQ
jgi:hypothetical protein